MLGSINLDIVLQVETLPRRGETVVALRKGETPGGKGFNQAVAAARVGAGVYLIAASGCDQVGQDLRTFLVENGVNTEHLVELSGCSTGRAFISVEASGENVIVVDGGANLALKPEHLPVAGSLTTAVRLAQLETPLDTVAAFFEPDKGLRILNAAPTNLDAKGLFDRVDILILNETELQSFADLKTPPESQAQVVDAARRLMTRPHQSVIVTLGAAGSLLVTQTDADMIAGRKVLAVDTTGAGDCFCGVFAAGLADGLTMADALAQANAAAALSVGTAGAAPSMPHRVNLDAFIAATDPRALR